MLWYLAIVAALNLGLGYMWAARTRPCPRCARRHAAELRASRLKTADAAAAPPAAGAPDSAQTSAAATQPTHDVNTVNWDERYKRYFGGLNEYRGELTEVDRQLGHGHDDAEHVIRCATRLQAANDNYIGLAGGAIDQLDTEPICSLEKEVGQTKLRESVGGQLNVATKSKEELAKLDIAANPTAARDTLKKTIKDFHKSTDGLREEVEACLESMRLELGPIDDDVSDKPADRDPATGLATREHAEFVIGQLAVTVGDGNPVTVALLELDGASAGLQADGTTDVRLLGGVSNILRQSLSAEHTAARFSDQQFLIVVPHEDVDQASRRTEEMRQRVDSTEFVVDGQSIKTTVTCALAQISKERTSEKLFEFLEEALSEAKRYGGNRTFTHDGSSPAPIVPPDLAVGPQQLAI